MKLHLPKLLRNALLACITAVAGISATVGTATVSGVALATMVASQQAAAATLTEIARMEDLIAGGTVGETVVNNSGTGYTSYIFDGESAITGIANQAVLDAITSTSSTSRLVVAAWVKMESGGGGSIFSYGAQKNGMMFVTSPTGMKLTTKGANDYAASGTLATDEWVLVALSVCFDSSVDSSRLHTGFTDGSHYSKRVGGMNATAEEQKLFAIGSGNAVADANGPLVRDAFRGEIQNLTIFVADGEVNTSDVAGVMGTTAPSLLAIDWISWNSGATTDNVWSGSNWGDPAGGWTDGKGASFIGSGETVQITSDAAASYAKVEGEGWVFTGSGTLTVQNTLTVGDGTNAASLDLSNYAGLAAAEVNVKNKAVLNIGGTSVSNVSVNGGTLKVNTGTTVDLGDLLPNLASTASSVLEISGTNTVVTTTHTNEYGIGFFKGHVKLNAGTRLELKNYDGLGWSNGYETNKLTIENATLAIGGRTTFMTDIDMQGNAIITSTTYGGTDTNNRNNEAIIQVHEDGTNTLVWDVSNKGNKVESGVCIRMNKNLGISVDADGELLIEATTERTDNNAGPKEFTKSGAGVLALSGNQFAESNINVTNGKLRFNGASERTTQTVLTNGGLEIGAAAEVILGNLSGYGTVDVTAGGTLTLNTVNVAAEQTITINGDVNAGSSFACTGAGALQVNGTLSASNVMTMNGMNLTATAFDLAANTELIYGEGNVLGLGEIDKAVILNVYDVLSSMEAGIDTGISATEATLNSIKSLITVDGYAAGDISYTIGENGHLWISSSAAMQTVWDINWGATLSGQPDSVTQLGEFTPKVFNNGSEHYYSLNRDAGELTVCEHQTCFVAGGVALYPNEAVPADARTEGDSWVRVSGGTYQAIAGGNVCNNWGSSSRVDFIGDSHVMMSGGTSNFVVGGNFNDAFSAQFIGDTYVTITGDASVTRIVGGSTVSHKNAIKLVGNTNVYVYSALESAGSVVGSHMHNTNVGSVMTHEGSSNVTVDLSSYAGEVTNFGKLIIGGGWLLRSWSGSSTLNLLGDTNVSVTGKEGITFSKEVIGGSYHEHEQCSSTMGNINLSLAGTVNNNVIGGSYLNSGSVNTMTVKNINITVESGGVSDWSLIGGHYIRGTGEEVVTATTGDITVKLNGGKTKDVYGGSYTERNKAESTITQGNVSVVLSSGTLQGDVYAAGNQKGSTKMSTASTTVSIAEGVTMALHAHDEDGVQVISGGYKFAAEKSGSTVTGDRKLVLSGTQDRSGVVFQDFNVVEVTDTGSATLGALSTTSFTKKGTGNLTVNSHASTNMGAATVEQGSLTLNGTYSIAGGVSVGNGAKLVTAGATTLGGALTLNNGAALDVSAGLLTLTGDTAGVALTLGTGLNLNIASFGEAETMTILSGVASATGLSSTEVAASSIFSSIMSGGDNVLDNCMVKLDGTNVVLLYVEKELVWNGADGSLSGSSYADGGVYDADSSIVFGAVAGDAALNVAVGATDVVRKVTIQDGGKYNFTGEELEVTSAMSVGTGAVVNVAGGISVGEKLESTGSLSTSKITGAGNVSITGGTLTLSDTTNALSNTGSKNISGTTLAGTWKAAGVTVGAGTTYDAATGTYSGATSLASGANVTLENATLAGTVVNGAGNLTLSGAVTLVTSGYNKATTGETFSGTDGNGFKYATALYTIASDASKLNANGVTWSVDSTTRAAVGDVSYADGVVTVVGELQGTAYWVNNNVTYDAGDKFSGATALKLAGGTLTLNKDLASNLTDKIVVDSSSNLVIGDKVTLAAADITGKDDSKVVTVSGTGTLNMAAATSTTGLEGLDTGTETTGWRGTVQLNGVTSGALNLNELGNAYSTIELTNCTGYWGDNPATSSAATIVLNAGTAINFNQGSSSDGRNKDFVMNKFTGTVRGEGNVVCTWNTTNYTGTEFSGDVSGWTGAFEQQSSAKYNLVFSGGASTIKAAIGKSSTSTGSLSLKLNADAATTLTNTVNVTTINVLNDKDVTFQGATTANSLSSAQAKVTATGALTLLNGASTVKELHATGGLTLGTAAAGSAAAVDATLAVTEALTLGGSLKVNTIASGVTADSLAIADAGLTVDVSSLISSLAVDDGNRMTLLTLTNGYAGNGTVAISGVDTETAKLYKFSTAWDTDNKVLSLVAAKQGATWDTEAKWSELGADEDENVWLSGAGNTTVEIDSDAKANVVKVNVSDTSATKEYELTGKALELTELQVAKGTLTVSNATTVKTAVTVEDTLVVSETGTLDVQGNMAAAGVTITNDGTLKLHKGTLGGLVGSDGAAAGTLEITDQQDAGGNVEEGAVSIAGSVVLDKLTNAGSLTVVDAVDATSGLVTTPSKLTLNNATTEGGTVIADEVVLKDAGNVFTSITTDTLVIDKLDATNAALKVETLNAATSGGSITLVLDVLDPALTQTGAPSLQAATYKVIDAANGLDAVNTVVNANKEWQEYLYQNGKNWQTLSHSFDADGNLTISATDGVADVWNTSKYVTENGLLVTAEGTAAPVRNLFSILDNTDSVNVDADRTLDLGAVVTEAGDTDRTANINNLKGNGTAVLSLVGAGAETVVLTATAAMQESEAANVKAEDLTLTVGDTSGNSLYLNQLTAGENAVVQVADKGMLDAAAVAVTDNGEVQVLAGGSLASDAINLTTAESSLVVDASGTASTTALLGVGNVAGKLSITAGAARAAAGSFNGTYTAADICMAGGQQVLAPKAGLTVSGASGTAALTYDSAATMDALKTTGATVILDRVAEGAYNGSMLTLTEDSSMEGGQLVFSLTREELNAGGTKVISGKLDTNGTEIVISTNATGALDVESMGDTLAIIGSGTNKETKVTLNGEIFAKYFSEVTAEKGALKVTRNTSYFSNKLAGETENGKAGLALADAALVKLNPQLEESSALGMVLTELESMTSGKAADELGAALAGAGTAVLGLAVSNDVERQLKAIRNRTTTMGVDQSVANEEMPYFNAWINAEGDHHEMSEDGTLAGYKLSSWGGTVGFDVDMDPTFTAGMALTAMYGDLDATSADKATGELNSYYVTAFARYTPSAWTHTFVGTIGKSDISMERTVAGNKVEGDTNAMSFGLMYETGRVIALTEDGTTCLQPVFNVTWRHTTVDAYREKGGDLGLSVEEQTMDTITFGLGARLQSVVGESMYNRTSVFECRVLAKADAGDRTGTSKVELAGATAEVDSAEVGAVGVEAGMGLTIPVGQEGGSIFMDASIDLRADYINANGTVGYRVNF